MVDNEISRLKTDLNQLLQFNENLLHFDSSIVKNAAKTKVEKFMQKLSATIDRQLLNDETAEHTAEKLETAAEMLLYLLTCPGNIKEDSISYGKDYGLEPWFKTWYLFYFMP